MNAQVNVDDDKILIFRFNIMFGANTIYFLYYNIHKDKQHCIGTQ